MPVAQKPRNILITVGKSISAFGGVFSLFTLYLFSFPTMDNAPAFVQWIAGLLNMGILLLPLLAAAVLFIGFVTWAVGKLWVAVSTERQRDGKV